LDVEPDGPVRSVPRRENIVVTGAVEVLEFARGPEFVVVGGQGVGF
jgi:hypothetical protein